MDKQRPAIRARLRLDYGVEGRRGWFGNRHPQREVEEIREEKMALLRNLPLQGLEIEEVDGSAETYTVTNEVTGRQVVYAPVMLNVRAERLEDLLHLAMLEEVRKIEIAEPEEITLRMEEMQHLLFRAAQESRAALRALERKLSSR